MLPVGDGVRGDSGPLRDTVSSSGSSRCLPLSDKTTGAFSIPDERLDRSGLGGHETDRDRERDAERREVLDGGLEGG